MLPSDSDAATAGRPRIHKPSKMLQSHSGLSRGFHKSRISDALQCIRVEIGSVPPLRLTWPVLLAKYKVKSMPGILAPKTLLRRKFLTGMFAFCVTALAGPRFAPAAASSGGKQVKRLRRWSCTNQDCEPYIYDPSLGDENYGDPENPIPPGVAFEDLPEDWVCPTCEHPKNVFVPLDEWVEVAV